MHMLFYSVVVTLGVLAYMGGYTSLGLFLIFSPFLALVGAMILVAICIHFFDPKSRGK